MHRIAIRFSVARVPRFARTGTPPTPPIGPPACMCSVLLKIYHPSFATSFTNSRPFSRGFICHRLLYIDMMCAPVQLDKIRRTYIDYVPVFHYITARLLTCPGCHTISARRNLRFHSWSVFSFLIIYRCELYSFILCIHLSIHISNTYSYYAVSLYLPASQTHGTAKISLFG